ncbi:MAG: ATP-binding protein [Richelia sp. RM2_1_2]|nr:ATP-binding protein [Richelia sp. RM2_1_2]
MVTRKNQVYRLTDIGEKKIIDALKKQEVGPHNQASWLREATEKIGERLSKDTILKILRKQRVKKKSIQSIFNALELQYKPSEDSIEDLKDTSITENKIAEKDAAGKNFVGREGAIASLNTLVNEGKKVILIQAEGGVGKTTLARHYLETQGFDIVIEYAMAKECQNISSVESVIEEWLKRHFNEEPGREFGISLDRLRNKLQDKNKKIGIFIDNLEPALENGRFIENHRRYVELLSVLNHPNVQSLTLITSREPIYESGIKISDDNVYCLEGLSKEAWNQFFESCRINTGSSPLDEKSALSLMHKAYGGNAEAMFIFSGAIKIECQGDLEAYWQKNHDDLLINPTLENLIEGQFNKLQHDNPKAYRLLCRLGCYRYQDVPLVPEEGIYYLLWDVREEQRKRVIKALRDRSLIKCSNEEFYLHPVIKAEARKRLTKSYFKITNRKIAEFWTESIDTIETVENALRAFEAYHHYLEIGQFESCGIVCTKYINNKWNISEPLGVACCRLGLLHPMINAINRIKGNINSKYILSRLHNILGDLYWQAGYLQLAINSHELSEMISSKALECSERLENENIIFKLKRLKIVSFFNRGVCNLYLWNLEEAIVFFTTCKTFAEDSGFVDYLFGCHYCLSFIYSCIGSLEKASDFAMKAEQNVTTRLTLWSYGYSYLLLAMTYKNLRYVEKSFERYRQANLFAKNIHYTQLEAKSLTGLAELYREQKEFDIALKYHSESIELLNKLRAQCDLAEAYYQQALTYKKMGNKHKSQVDFDTAIQLFEEVEAPKQVEKVRQAM